MKEEERDSEEIQYMVMLMKCFSLTKLMSHADTSFSSPMQMLILPSSHTPTPTNPLCQPLPSFSFIVTPSLIPPIHLPIHSFPPPTLHSFPPPTHPLLPSSHPSTHPPTPSLLPPIHSPIHSCVIPVQCCVPVYREKLHPPPIVPFPRSLPGETMCLQHQLSHFTEIIN